MDRFPARELDIHRACARDEDFRSICVDHEEASVALRRFRESGEQMDGRVREYESLLEDLADEIWSYLEHADARPKKDKA
ncbi:hypothetical protein [Pseudoruegeria sp. HB172150]|uniref:hypothetical protein n=1 Tax=Pseudoruegeria sp. HB172150 TaxID=2721164 RepID=UPI001C132409|nr:hypothetical protein [Pseudoruegeria sp. HB172150]